LDNVKELKARIRERIWRLLEEKNIARFPRPVYGRIPNFIGAEEAASNLFKTRMWVKAHIIKVNPDSPQRIVRLRALHEGKILLMPTPRLREGFLLLDPNVIPSRDYSLASSIKGAFIYGRKLGLVELLRIESVDLIVIGSVAVDYMGTRIGKGGGYAELEYAILREIGKVDDKTLVVTTVHDIQVLSEELPRELHDVPVDVIYTPTRTIRAKKSYPKPKGIYWELLSKDKLDSIPILRELKKVKG